MPADEQVGMMTSNLIPDARCVFFGVPANMGHEYIDLFASEMQFFREQAPDILAVDISIYTTNKTAGFFSDQMINTCMAPVACMPDFAASGQVLQDRFIQVAVCIRKQCDSGQSGEY